MLILIIVRQFLTDFLRSWLPGKHAVMQHDGCRHALIVVVHDRHKDRGVRKACYLLHLRDMLMAKGEPINARSGELLLPVVRLILGNHLLAAARIAGEGIACDRVIRRKDPHSDERGSR